MQYVVLSLEEAHNRGWKIDLGRGVKTFDQIYNYQIKNGLFLVDAAGNMVKMVVVNPPEWLANELNNALRAETRA